MMPDALLLLIFYAELSRFQRLTQEEVQRCIYRFLQRHLRLPVQYPLGILDARLAVLHILITLAIKCAAFMTR